MMQVPGSEARRGIAGFAGPCALLLLVFLLSSPLWERAYGAWFRTLGNVLFHRATASPRIRFDPLPADTPHGFDTAVSLAQLDRPAPDGRVPVRTVRIGSRGIGGIPTAFVLALVLATRAPPRQRITRAAVATGGVQAFVAVTLAVIVLSETRELTAGGAQARSVSGWLLFGLHETLVTHFGAGLLVPVLIWAAVVGLVSRGEVLARQRGRDGEPGQERP